MEFLLTLLIVALFVVVALAALGWIRRRQQRTAGLRAQFGPEYDRALADTGGRSRAEADLDERRKRVERLHIVELDPEEGEVFARDWTEVQARFVDRPSEAIAEAEALVTRVMDRRGYPIADFDQQAADISVDHPEVVAEYREARAIALKNADGGASTEELRQAMLHYRALFQELLGKTAAA